MLVKLLAVVLFLLFSIPNAIGESDISESKEDQLCDQLYEELEEEEKEEKGAKDDKNKENNDGDGGGIQLEEKKDVGEKDSSTGEGPNGITNKGEKDEVAEDEIETRKEVGAEGGQKEQAEEKKREEEKREGDEQDTEGDKLTKGKEGGDSAEDKDEDEQQEEEKYRGDEEGIQQEENKEDTGNQDENGKGPNMALLKKVFGRGQGHLSGTDGKLNTTFSPDADIFPYSYVDLGAVYDLASINLFCQNDLSLRQSGINLPFDVHTYSGLISPCNFAALYPWDKLASNLTCERKGDEIVLKSKKPVRYIIIGHPNTRYPQSIENIPIGEVQAHGEKLYETSIPQIPDDGPLPENYYKETRRKIIGCQRTIWMHPKYGYFKPNYKYKDVVLGWMQIQGPLGMAVVREQAKMILLMGKTMTIEIDDPINPRYQPIRASFKRWLANNLPDANYVNIGSKYAPGDVLLITRDDHFDVDDVYRKLVTGQNSALVGYTVKDGEDNLSELLKKLNVDFVRTKRWIGSRFIGVHASADSNGYIPASYQLERYVQNWKALSHEPFSKGFGDLDAETKHFQQVLRAVADKYEELMEHLGPCDLKPYHKDRKTATALMNYNSILTYQYGATGYVLPHIDRHPGTVSSKLKPSNIVATVYADLEGSFFPIAAYAKPGEGFRWTVLRDSDESFTKQWLRINAQTDKIGHHSQWRRWPSISTEVSLTRQGQITSPHGGPIVLQLPKGVNITIRLENVYRYAWLDLRNPASIESFEEEVRKYVGVPWLVISGDSMNSMLRTVDVYNSNASEVISTARHFDNAIKVMHNYRGSRWEDTKSEMFVTDLQLSSGDGHGGYPLMGRINWSHSFTMWSDSIKNGGQPQIVNVIGENLKVLEAMLKGGDEVLPNVYNLLVNDVLLGLNPYTHDNDTIKWGSLEYEGPGLGYYRYLGKLFGFGLVGNAFTEARKARPQNEEVKTQFWLQQLCKETGYNLLPFHQMWNFPITKQTEKICDPMPCFFPDDEWTKPYQEKVNKMLEKREDVCIRLDPKKVKFRGEIKRGVDTVRSQNIFLTFE